MAVPLGLSAKDRKAYEATLLRSHRIQIVARIHNHDEKVISTIAPGKMLSGSVQVDMSQSPHRTAELTLLQPRTAPAWLPDGPSDAHVFAGNFLSVRYCVWVDELSAGPGWVDVPVFWGAITGLSQDGDEVTISASGKDVLGLDPHLLWSTGVHIAKGDKRTNAIRKVLAAQGETRFDLPDLGAKVGKKLSLSRHAQPWRVAKTIAGGANWQLFYDGRGRAKVRRWPQNRIYTFHGGDDGQILTKPKISYDVTSVRNIIEVLGPEPKGPPTRIRAVAQAAAKHPMSAFSLRRNGQRRWMVERVDSDLAKPELEWHAASKRHHGKNSISLVAAHWGAPSGVKNPRRWFEWRHSVIVHRKKKANDIAERHLANRLKATVDVTFDCLPIPHLEEGDLCAAKWEGQHFEFVLKQFTIPLTADSPMSIGINKRVSWRGKKQRKGKRRPR